MPFRLALSGLNAASADLGVTANNIANSSTAGFKESRAEFSELFAVSPQGVATLASGNGVRVSDIAQQFSQGNIDFTDNNLDLAISGTGFFTVSDNGSYAYTRAGAFRTDAL
jgi:flagellar hook protein FlgE